MPSYQYGKSHCGDTTVVRSSYLHNEISYTGKCHRYRIGALFVSAQKKKVMDEGLYQILRATHLNRLCLWLSEKLQYLHYVSYEDIACTKPSLCWLVSQRVGKNVLINVIYFRAYTCMLIWMRNIPVMLKELQMNICRWISKFICQPI